MTQTPSEDELFDQACQIDDTEQRNRFLDQACGGNAELRASLQELINCPINRKPRQRFGASWAGRFGAMGIWFRPAKI